MEKMENITIYEVPLVCGLTIVHPEIEKIYSTQFGSSDIEIDFIKTLKNCKKNLSKILNCKNEDLVIMSGEGMVALWASLKSVIIPGKTKVLSVSNGN
jgi:aspartate aminotransferase-like enzyme